MSFTDRLFGVVTHPFLLMIVVVLTCTALSVQWPITYLVAMLYVVGILLKSYYECSLEPEAMTRAGLVVLFFVLCYFPDLGNNDVMVMILPSLVLFSVAAVGIVIESRIRRRK